MNVSIYAPYSRCATTAAAIRVASVAQQAGWRVSYVASRAVQSGVHFAWDGKVRNSRYLLRSMKQSMCTVWFETDAAAFSDAWRNTSRSNQVFVPSWHQLRPKDFRIIGYFDSVISPSERVSSCVKACLDQNSIANLCVMPVAAGLEPVQKYGLAVEGYVHVLVPVDNPTRKSHGRAVIEALSFLLATFDNLRITVLSPTLWRELSAMQAHQPSRISVFNAVPFDQLIAHLYRCDAMWLPSVRSENAFPVQDALACGVPVVAWNIPPIDAHIVDGVNGLLVDCKSKKNWLGANTARWNSVELGQVFAILFGSDDCLRSLQSQDWEIDRQEGRFKDFWRSVFDRSPAYQ